MYFIMLVLVAIAAMPMLARTRAAPRRRRRRQKLVAIPFIARLTLVDLAASTVVKVSCLPSTFGEDFYCHQVTANYAMRDHSAGEGPLSFGYAHGDLGVAEILESITAEVSDPNDIIAAERARRPVRKTGNFPGRETEETFQNGMNVRTGLGFVVGNGFELDIWALNNSGVQFTTGTVIEIDGVIYGRWVI